MEIYFDHAATTRIAPEALEAMVAFEKAGRGNPFRGVHAAAERATQAYEDARRDVAEFFGASPGEFVFTKGTTEGLNLVARGLADVLQPGDEIILSLFEHHAHLLPWREVAQKRGCVLRFVPLTADGLFDVEAFRKMVSEKTKVVAVTHVSNILGSIVPVKEVTEIAKRFGAFVCVDGAQAAGHLPVNIRDLGVDAYAMSAHKMYGPMGIGGLFLSERLQAVLPPFLLGGGMIEEMLADGCPVYAEGTRRFEAGTPNVTGAVGFAAACRVFLEKRREIYDREARLTEFLWDGLSGASGVMLYGPKPGSERTGVIAFTVLGMHPHDVAQKLADRDIAVRAGFHCAASLARCLHPDGVVRVSVGRDSTEEECRRFLEAL
jgi:cysteine desulfurase / selenocysteine lyase